MARTTSKTENSIMVGATHTIQMPGSQAEAWYGVSLCLKLNYNTRYCKPIFRCFIYRYPKSTNLVLKKFLFGRQLGIESNPDQKPCYIHYRQCSGSMTFWWGSGSADPCLWLMDPDSDPDPAIFVIDLQNAYKKLFLKFIFSAYYFLKKHLHLFFKDKKSKKITK